MTILVKKPEFDVVFTTHSGKKYKAQDRDYISAIKKVADDCRKNAKAILDENHYASHVSQEVKNENYQAAMKHADEIESGNAKKTLWLWQRLNTELTGVCVALLP